MSAMGALQSDDLCLLAGDAEPRVQDLRLAEALEFKALRQIRELITRNLEELQRYGSLSCGTTNPGPQGGRPGSEYWLNEAQAILICMRSDAPRAADVRAELIAVFQAWRRGQLVNPGVTLQAIDHLFDRNLSPIRRDMTELKTHVARIDGNVIRLERRVDDIVPRHEFSTETKRQWRYVVGRRYNGECPCCRKVRILDVHDGALSGELNYDHFNGRELNGPEDGWPVCQKCNHRLRLDNNFKSASQTRFETFQQDRRDLCAGHPVKAHQRRGSPTLRGNGQGDLFGR